jgi:hypothetical protein
MTDSRWLRCLVLLATAGQADWPAYSLDVRLFRDFVLANRGGSGDDRAGTGITRVRGEVKIVFAHQILISREMDVGPSDRSASAHQVYDDHDHGDDQQQVNQATRHVQAKTQEPQNQQYRDNRPKHFNFLDSFLVRRHLPNLNGVKQLPAFQARAVGARRDQSAKRAHSL